MVKLGILGAGIITECHFYGIDRIDGATVAAIASVDEAAGKAAADKYGAALYTDYRELLDKEKSLDGIIVALPNFMHREAVEYAIKAGHKNILCEKPLGINPAESAGLVKLAKESGANLQVGYMKRFNPGFQLIKDAMAELGTIQFITVELYMTGPDPAKMKNNASAKNVVWQDDALLNGGGLITSSSSHQIDLLQYLFGTVKSISCKCRYIGDRDYYLKGIFTTEDGVDIDIRLGRVDLPTVGPDWQPYRKPSWNESVEVVGANGYIKADNPNWRGWDAMKVKRWMKGQAGPEIIPFNCADQWVNEMLAFVQSCKTGRPDPRMCTAAGGYRTDYLIERIHESSKLGGKELAMDYEF